ncbi:MAG: hypothetical protein IJS53_02370 [Clostridia bacterium]|nr:hypothetical protein [Clostridia bacterium]
MVLAHEMKKRFALVLALLALVLLFALPAMAEEDVIFSLSVDPETLTEPGPVTVSIRVANNSGKDMTEPVTLYDPDGKVVASFGDGGAAVLQKDAIVTAQQTYQVSQSQLKEGRLTYMLSYKQGDTVQEVFKHVEIAYAGTHAELIVNRVIMPDVVRSGETVTVQYELYNAGNVEIRNIRVRENSSLSGASQAVATLAPGERTTLKFTASMGSADLKSQGVVTYYEGTGGQQKKITLDEVTIPRAVPGLVLNDMLSADRTAITSGETVTLTLTIKNNGNISYSNISVLDAKYGELFTNLTLGPGETLVKEKQFTLSETTTFKYTVVLPDNTGNSHTETSNEVKVSVYDPSQVMMLSVTAEADTTTIASMPADVRFTVTVTNNSPREAKNIKVLHGSVQVATISSLAPSESAVITRDFTISQAGKFRFTASALDALNNTVTFDSNELTITYAAPTATPTMAPVVTIAPLVTLTVAPIEVLEPVTIQTNAILRIVAIVLVALFAVVFALFVVSTVMRAKRRNASRSAYDHMELGGTRDYTEPASYSYEDEEPEEEILPPSATKPSDELLQKVAAPAAPAGGENGAYRLTREDGQLPPAEAPAEEDPAAEAPAEKEAAEETPAEEVPAEEAPVRHRRAGRTAPSEDDE